MALTQDDKQSIINAVLSAVRTNSKSIDQLSLATRLTDADMFEINGGRRVSFKVISDLINEIMTSKTNEIKETLDGKSLKSVEITATSTSATITITSNDNKSIKATIPVATTSRVGLITPADKETLTEVRDILDDAPNGIPVLGDDHKILATYLPAKNVVEFVGFVSGSYKVEMEAARLSSTSEGCGVLYDAAKNIFVLRDGSGKFYINWADRENYSDVMGTPEGGRLYVDSRSNKIYRWDGTNLITISGGNTEGGESAVVTFAGVANIPAMGIQDGTARGEVRVYFTSSLNTFVGATGAGPQTEYFREWKGSENYLTAGAPRTDRLFFSPSSHTLYIWDSRELREIGARSDDNTSGDGHTSCIAFFDGFDEAGDVDFISSMSSSTDLGNLVIYDSEREAFLMRSPQGWHNNWNDVVDFGEPGLDGVQPDPRKLYICKDEERIYRFDGITLVGLSGGPGSVVNPEDYNLMSEEDGRSMVQDIFGDFRFSGGGDGSGTTIGGDFMTPEEGRDLVDDIFRDKTTQDDIRLLSKEEALDMVNNIFK